MPARRHPVLHVEHSPKHQSFTVLHRSPQLTGDPEFAVARDGPAAEVVALFFSPDDANDYAHWKTQAH